MSKVKEFLSKEKIFITQDALEILESLEESEIIDLILNEIKNIDELITKETINELIKKYSKDLSLKEQNSQTYKREIKEVSDITMGYKLMLEDRFNKLKKIIEKVHRKTAGITSIDLDKMLDKSQVSIAGMLYNKESAKYDALLLEFEDPYGSFRAIVPKYKKEAYQSALEMKLDDVAILDGILIKTDKGYYIRVNKIYLPDLEFEAEKKLEKNIYIACISDIRYGNETFDYNAFQNLIDFLNNKFDEYKEISSKIKYLLITGDLIEGFSFESKFKFDITDDMYSQYEELAGLLSNIRQDITIYSIPGERDQLIQTIPFNEFDQEIAEPLFKFKNLILLKDPSYIDISQRKILMTHGYYFESLFKENIVDLEKLEEVMIKTMKDVIKRRSLISSVRIEGLLPLGYDPFIIDERPDLMLCGHFDIYSNSSYHGCLLISNSSWINYLNDEKPRHSCYVINLKDLSIMRFLF